MDRLSAIAARAVAALRVAALAITALAITAFATTPGCAPRTSSNTKAVTANESRPFAIKIDDGSRVHPLDGPAGALVAIVFISHECPIANAMAPDLRALAEQAAANGVALHLVHPSPWATRDELLRHAREFGFVSVAGPGVSVLADPSQSLVARCGATITPEGALVRLDGRGDGEILYLGRVNDLYVGIGRRRPSISSNDLRDAIDAALAGRAIPQPFPKAVGCFIESPR